MRVSLSKWSALFVLLLSQLAYAESPDLGQLFRLYGSDKDTNGYTSVYHTLFDHMKQKPMRLLEIGIGTMIPNVPSSMVGYSRPGYKPGGSLRAWRDYFVRGDICFWIYTVHRFWC